MEEEAAVVGLAVDPVGDRSRLQACVHVRQLAVFGGEWTWSLAPVFRYARVKAYCMPRL